MHVMTLEEKSRPRLIIVPTEELKKEREVSKAARQNVARMKVEMQKVMAECDGFKAAAAFSENDQQEELRAIHSKYQEEIASLQHIMKGLCSIVFTLFL